MNSAYSQRQRKIYEDYHPLSTEKLLEFLKNASKYDDTVIDVIRDILIERDAIEGEKPNDEEAVPAKQRHGCVTAWLIFMIVANALASLVYLVAGNQTLKMIPESYRMLFVSILVIAGLLNIYFASLLLSWKKAGFTGLCIMAGIMLFVNLGIGIGILESLFGLVGILIMYAILQIEKDGVSAWSQME